MIRNEDVASATNRASGNRGDSSPAVARRHGSGADSLGMDSRQASAPSRRLGDGERRA